MDMGTLSLLLLIGLLVLLAMGMPLGFASAALAGAVLMMKFSVLSPIVSKVSLSRRL